jgi:hypothetical protein
MKVAVSFEQDRLARTACELLRNMQRVDGANSAGKVPSYSTPQNTARILPETTTHLTRGQGSSSELACILWVLRQPGGHPPARGVWYWLWFM